jgi:hypothetical protein
VVDVLRDASGAAFEILSVENRLFGPRVTTAGLLAGADIAAALAGQDHLDFALVPGEAVNDDGLFIDNLPFADLRRDAPMPVRLSKDFADALHA